jgi:predicted RNase H-like HicB family nuclease
MPRPTARPFNREALLRILAKPTNLWHTPNMKREFNVVIERDSEGFYVASVPELHGCHTQARSLDKLLNRIKEAIELCLEVADPGIAPPEFVGVQRVA